MSNDDIKKKNKNVKFDKDRANSDKNQQDHTFLNDQTKSVSQFKNEFQLDNLHSNSKVDNPLKENDIPYEKKPLIKSAFDKLFSKSHEKKENNNVKVSIMKSNIDSQKNMDNEKHLQKLLTAKSQKKKRVKNILIDKDWLKNNKNYDTILLNAFYLDDIKRNLRKTKVS